MKVRLFVKPYRGWSQKAMRWQILAGFGPGELQRFLEEMSATSHH